MTDAPPGVPSTPEPTPPPPAPWRLLFLLMLLDAAVVLPTLGMRTLWQIDEARFAQVAREMASTGDWIIPRIGGQVYDCYPPLAYWTVAASGTLFGWNEWAVRLPGALAGVLLVGLCGGLAWHLTRSRLAAASAAVALATTFGFVAQQVTGRADTLLALFATAAVLLAERITSDGARPRRVAAFYACVALGVLTKGPLGIALPGLVVGAWIFARRRWDWIASMKPWWGLPAVLLVVLPWYVALAQVGGTGALGENLLVENVEAFISGHSHPQPVAYYLPRLPSRAIPWILALAALPWLPRARKEGLFALSGALATFIFLTASTSKRMNYLTYLYPLVAVSSGIALAELLEGTRGRRATSWGLLALAAAVALGTISLAMPSVPWKAKIVTVAMPSLILACLLGATALAAGAALLWRNQPAAALGLLGSALAAGILFQHAVFMPRLDDEGLAGRAFGRSIGDLVPPGETIGAIGIETKAYFLFYIPQRVLQIRTTEAFARSGLRYGFSREADRPADATTLATYRGPDPDDPLQVLWQRP